MIEEEMLKCRHVIGLDIGDGESTLAWSSTNRGESPCVYQRQSTAERSILTALAHNPQEDGKYLFGEEALSTGNPIQFAVNFKREPTPGEPKVPDAVLFAKALLDEFFEVNGDVRKGCVVFIGHPAGWSPAAVEEYRRHLQRLGPPVYLLAESQSAMVHVWDRSRDRSSESKLLDNVLVIDIGSSTTDVSVVDDMIPTNLDVGVNLGCRQLDEELAGMARQTLAGDREFSDALKRQGGEELLLLASRLEKEAQFSRGQAKDLDRIRNSRLTHSPGLKKIMDLGFGWLQGQEIKKIAKRPGGWAESFNELIGKVKERLEKPPSLIILTGGGSRMEFVEKICEERFPGVIVAPDPEPSLSVARGLVSAGLQRVQIARFRRDMNAIVISPETDKLVREQIEHIFKATKESTIAAIRKAPPYAWATIIKKPPGQERLVGELQRSVSCYLVPPVREFCEAYGIDDSRFDLNLTLPPFFATELIEDIRVKVNLGDFRIDDPARVSQKILVAHLAPRGFNPVEVWKNVRARDPATLAVATGLVAIAVMPYAATLAQEGIQKGLDWYYEGNCRPRPIAKQRLIKQLSVTELAPDASSQLINNLSAKIRVLVEKRASVVERFVTPA